MSTIEIEPKYDDFWAENVCYRLQRPTLRQVMYGRWSKLRLRQAMLSVKRLFHGNVPHIEDARTVELVECEGECWLRIRMDG